MIAEEDPIVEIPIDSFLNEVMEAWLLMQAEGQKQLDATFAKHDANGDGHLSLAEFTGIVKEVDKLEKRFLRPVSCTLPPICSVLSLIRLLERRCV